MSRASGLGLFPHTRRIRATRELRAAWAELCRAERQGTDVDHARWLASVCVRSVALGALPVGEENPGATRCAGIIQQIETGYRQARALALWDRCLCDDLAQLHREVAEKFRDSGHGELSDAERERAVLHAGLHEDISAEYKMLATTVAPGEPGPSDPSIAA